MWPHSASNNGRGRLRTENTNVIFSSLHRKQDKEKWRELHLHLGIWYQLRYPSAPKRGGRCDTRTPCRLLTPSRCAMSCPYFCNRVPSGHLAKIAQGMCHKVVLAPKSHEMQSAVLIPCSFFLFSASFSQPPTLLLLWSRTPFSA